MDAFEGLSWKKKESSKLNNFFKDLIKTWLKKPQGEMRGINKEESESVRKSEFVGPTKGLTHKGLHFSLCLSFTISLSLFLIDSLSLSFPPSLSLSLSSTHSLSQKDTHIHTPHSHSQNLLSIAYEKKFAISDLLPNIETV